MSRRERPRLGVDANAPREIERSFADVRYRVATVDELQDIAYRQETHMRPVRHHLGISAFGTNAWTAANGATN